MNRIRRKHLDEILVRLEEIRLDLEEIAEDEHEAFDNIPENLWGSERYELAEAACDALDDALSSLEEAADSITSAME